jgi:hypothetical protein
MYNLDNILVSDSHLMKYKNKWIRVSEHPMATKIEYTKPFLYCLNTSKHVIKIKSYIFSDWDEIMDTLYKINLFRKKEIINPTFFIRGFHKNTKILLHDGNFKKIKNIKVNDVLQNNIKVYGTVTSLDKYHLLTENKYFCINNTQIYDYNSTIDMYL